MIVSEPGAAFAAMTASRREQSLASETPSFVSYVFVTVKFAARAACGISTNITTVSTAATTIPRPPSVGVPQF